VEHSADLQTKAPEVAYRRIANGLRDEILSGKFVPGQQLPSQGKLAAVWHSNAFTIHMAVKTLAKEGWVHSIRGGGVYVTQPTNRFICAGLLGATFSSESEPPFFQRLHVSLLEQFRRLRKETLIFTDIRPMSKQVKVLPALAEAIRTRRIQCLVFPIVHSVNLPALSRLALPTATMSRGSVNQVDFDKERMLLEGVRHLASQGCRSIGLMSNIVAKDKVDPFHRTFRKIIRESGLITRSDWIRRPSHTIREVNLESHGYAEFRHLWELREKPDGLIVYPDTMARGVIMSILDFGKTLVTQQMKFVFHRNAHLNIFCPFPVMWAISDEEVLAKGLIEQIEKQFAGEKTSPVFLPYRFQNNEGPHVTRAATSSKHP
jgi:DNA-binding LacI/PurR family transcriptional regulator